MKQVEGVPKIFISLDGRKLGTTDMQALAEIQVRQGLSVPAQCELLFRAPPGPLAFAEEINVGTQIQVDVEGPLFIGEVTAVEYVYTSQNEREIYIRSYDALYNMRKNQTVRVFKKARLGELARKFAAQAGIEFDNSMGSDVNVRWPLVYQHQQSDLELLIDLAGQTGLYPVIHSGKLNLVSLNGGQPTVRLMLGENLGQARIEVNADALVERIEVQSWNPQNAEFAQREYSQAQGNTVSVRTSKRLGSGKHTLLNKTATYSSDSHIAAKAEMTQRAARGVSFWGVANGNFALYPGVTIDVVGVTKAVEGLYVVTEANHTITGQSGYETELNTLPPPPTKKSTSDVMTLGKVISVSDPDDLGRVKAVLPTFGDVETDWMQVLSPGAGSNKGFAAPPEAGDMVLVLLVDGDPAFGLVIGGLYNNKSRPPHTRGLGNSIARNAWVTASGQFLELDDSKNKIRLENNKGAYIEIAGGKITIAGSAIDFKRK